MEAEIWGHVKHAVPNPLKIDRALSLATLKTAAEFHPSRHSRAARITLRASEEPFNLHSPAWPSGSPSMKTNRKAQLAVNTAGPEANQVACRGTDGARCGAWQQRADPPSSPLPLVVLKCPEAAALHPSSHSHPLWTSITMLNAGGSSDGQGLEPRRCDSGPLPSGHGPGVR